MPMSGNSEWDVEKFSAGKLALSIMVDQDNFTCLSVFSLVITRWFRGFLKIFTPDAVSS